MRLRRILIGMVLFLASCTFPENPDDSPPTTVEPLRW